MYKNSILVLLFIFCSLTAVASGLKLTEQEKCNNAVRRYCVSKKQAKEVDATLLELKEEGKKITHERMLYYAREYSYLNDPVKK